MISGWDLFLLASVGLLIGALFVLWLSRTRRPVVGFPGPRRELRGRMAGSLRVEYGLSSMLFLSGALWQVGGGVLAFLLPAALGYLIGVFWARLRMRGFSIVEAWEDGAAERPEGELAAELARAGVDLAHGRVDVLPLWVDLLFEVGLIGFGMLLRVVFWGPV